MSKVCWKFTSLALLVSCFLCLEVQAGKKWKIYDNCHLEDSASNDGDSFWMKYTRPGYGRRYFIRLYFVDCPESDKSVPDRVTQQAEWWGISEDQVVAVGKQATKFTKRFLSDGFVVKSQLQDALGRSSKKRNYANVYVGDLSLAEALMANGFARIYGFQKLHPDGPKVSTFMMRLKAAEKAARAGKKGVWGFAGGMSPAEQRLKHPGGKAPAVPTRNILADRPTISSMRLEPEPEPEQLGGRKEIEPHDRTISRYLQVFSLKDGSRKGTLRPGHQIKVLKEEPDNMVRIRFRWGEKLIEAQCMRPELGI